MVFLRTYKVRQVVRGSFIVSLPPSFARPNGIDQGNKLACFLNKDNAVVYRPVDHDKGKKGECYVRHYKAQRSGKRGLWISLPPIFRDVNSIEVGDEVSCHLGEDEIFYRKE